MCVCVRVCVCVGERFSHVRHEYTHMRGFEQTAGIVETHGESPPPPHTQERHQTQKGTLSPDHRSNSYDFFFLNRLFLLNVIIP